MARLAAVLRALARAFHRGEKSFGSIAGNNFFLASVVFLGKAGAFLYLVMGLVVLFPLSTDPLRKIPRSRLALWPLNHREHVLLRILSPWVNPLTWALAALALWAAHGAVTVSLWALFAGLFAAGFLLSDLPIHGGPALFRHMPHFPGPLDQLIRKNLRETLSTLDFWCALLLSLATVVYRAAGGALPPEALMAMTLLVVLALSSQAQCLFGLDGRGGLSRYRLLPLAGWRILAAKDAAFLSVAIPLTLPLAPLAGIGAALIALTMGRVPSVDHPRPQTRWRFSAGASPVYGIVEVAVIAMAGSAICLTSRLVLIPCVLAWLASLWWWGRRLSPSV